LNAIGNLERAGLAALFDTQRFHFQKAQKRRPAAAPQKVLSIGNWQSKIANV
jgi:hypothetical protein